MTKHERSSLWKVSIWESLAHHGREGMMVVILPQQVGDGAWSHLGGKQRTPLEVSWHINLRLHSYWPTLTYISHPKDPTISPHSANVCGKQVFTCMSLWGTFITQTIAGYIFKSLSHIHPLITVKGMEAVRRNKDEKQIERNKERTQAWGKFKKSGISWQETQLIFPGSSEYCPP